jgi:hypothetical protein
MSDALATWIGVYLQVSISFLVFWVGVPALSQALAPDDIRRIVNRRRTITVNSIIFGGPVIYALISILFVWIKYANNQILDVAQWILDVAITATILGCSLLFILLKAYQKDALLARLKKDCIRRIKSNGYPEDQAIEDIRDLGEQGDTRGEKIQVLEIFDGIVAKVQAHPSYDGRRLEKITEAIEFALQTETEVDSFVRGVHILKSIISNSQKLKLDSADRGRALRALQRLGAIACVMDNERPVRTVLDAVEFVGQNGTFSEATLVAFELGVASLKHGKFLVAVQALNKLETLTSAKEPLDAKNAAAYLGLVAHFWARGGSARQRAFAGLKGMKLKPTRQSCLKGAQKIHYRATRFETADLLTKMAVALGQKSGETGTATSQTA